MFDLDSFIKACQDALQERLPTLAMKEILERAISDRAGMESALGLPGEAKLDTLHQSSKLTVLNVIWAPEMVIQPLDHRMWSIIGVYGGKEDNTFYRRSPQGLSVSGVNPLNATEAAILGKSVIHSVRNPLGQFTGAIHIYGGDFFTVPRSEWDPVTFEERPYDGEKTREIFREANKRNS